MEENQNQNQSKGIAIPDSWVEEIDDKNSINAVIEVPENIKTDGFKQAAGKLLEINERGIVQLLEEDYHPEKS